MINTLLSILFTRNIEGEDKTKLTDVLDVLGCPREEATSEQLGFRRLCRTHSR